MKLSVSQLKTYNASPAKWAGLYILGIKEDFQNDAFTLGNLAEKYLISGEDDWSIIDGVELQDKEKFITQYDAIKHNAKGLEIPKGINQYQVNGILGESEFVGYIDILADDCIYDIKTTQYLTDKESKSINMRSNLTSYDEYALQLWVYMKLTGKTKAKILEVSKHLYKDGRSANQVLEFELTEEFDKQMQDKWLPVIQAIKELHQKYDFITKK